MSHNQSSTSTPAAIPAPVSEPFPLLATQRLQLREITMADAPDLLQVYGNAEVMRWFGTDPVTELAQVETMIARWANLRQQADPATRWGIQRAGESGLLGSCGLFAVNRAWRKCTLGYDLALQAQGQGYMQEALHVVLDWGFTKMELNRIEAQIHPDNLASINLVLKLGFHREGLLRQVGFWGGSFHDLIQFSLLRNEWVPQT